MISYKDLIARYTNFQNYIVSYSLYGKREISGAANVIRVFKTRQQARDEKKRLIDFYKYIKDVKIHRLDLTSMPMVR